MHIEQRRGTQKEAIQYCMKDGKYFEYGIKSEQGKRTDLQEVAKKICNGITLEQIKDEQPDMIVKYYKGLK